MNPYKDFVDETDSGSDIGIDEAYLIDVPDLTDNDDEEVVAVRKQYKEILSQRNKKKKEASGVDRASENRVDRASENEVSEDLCDVQIETCNFDNEDGDGEPLIFNARIFNEDGYEDAGNLSPVTDSSDSEGAAIIWQPSRTISFDPTSTDPQFHIGMVFEGKKQIIKALEKHCVVHKRQLIYIRNEAKRVRAVCSDPECNWLFQCSVQKYTGLWKIKTLVLGHSCEQVFSNKRINARVIAEHFIETLGEDLAMSLDKDKVIRRVRSVMGLEVTRNQARRICERISKHFTGDERNEYSLLPDYVNQLKKTNPGSTIELWCPRPNREANQFFKGIYICFDALKRGFKAGCRQFIGLDGCFLKGKYKGEILCAMGRDGNDQMFPLAWAVVIRENYETWVWFLSWLMADLDIDIGTGRNWTLMTDQQKGLDKAIKELLPAAEHRFCARHIFANWRKLHKGGDLQKRFWQCARATTVPDLRHSLAYISGNAKTALEKTPMHAWCRSHFDTMTKCDAYENNMCEVFNGNMLSIRYKAIYTLLEEIKVMVMTRIVQRRAYPVKNFKGAYGDKIWPKITAAANGSGDCRIDFCGEGNYEVLNDGDRYVVDLNRRTCSCRVWNLTGIPCKHVYRVMVSRKEILEDYVDTCYHKETFSSSYQYSMLPVEGEKFWDKTFDGEIDPPELRKKKGGRTKNKRVMEEWEAPSGTNLPRKGVKITCKECHQRGHNSRTCALLKAKIAKSKQNGGTPSATSFSVQRGLFVLDSSGDAQTASHHPIPTEVPAMYLEVSQQIQQHTDNHAGHQVQQPSTNQAGHQDGQVQVPTTTRSQTFWLTSRTRDGTPSTAIANSNRATPASKKQKGGRTSSSRRQIPTKESHV